MTLNLDGLEPQPLDDVVWGPHRWRFEAADIPTVAAIVLQSRYRAWGGAMSAIAENIESAAPELVQQTVDFEAILPALLAQIMGRRYPEWSAERIRAEMPEAVQLGLAGFFSEAASAKLNATSEAVQRAATDHSSALLMAPSAPSRNGHRPRPSRRTPPSSASPSPSDTAT